MKLNITYLPMIYDRISLYTMFAVVVLEGLCCRLIFNPPNDRTRDIATYSCPCENIGSGRYNPSRSNVWPQMFQISYNASDIN